MWRHDIHPNDTLQKNTQHNGMLYSSVNAIVLNVVLLNVVLSTDAKLRVILQNAVFLLSVILLSFMLSIVILRGIMPGVILLRAILPSVSAPKMNDLKSKFNKNDFTCYSLKSVSSWLF
jgi:hypothetical protein